MTTFKQSDTIFSIYVQLPKLKKVEKEEQPTIKPEHKKTIPYYTVTLYLKVKILHVLDLLSHILLAPFKKTI